MPTPTPKAETKYELRGGLLYVDGVLGTADPEAVGAAVDAWNAGEAERLDPFAGLAVAIPKELALLILHVARRMSARPESRLLPRAAILVEA